MKTHDLKCWPEPFAAMAKGLKPFEIRRDDRKFEVGDMLRLQEWRPAEEKYTGNELVRRVVWILSNEQFGIKPGFVVMAVAPPAEFLPPIPDAKQSEQYRRALEQIKLVALGASANPLSRIIRLCCNAGIDKHLDALEAEYVIRPKA